MRRNLCVSTALLALCAGCSKPPAGKCASTAECAATEVCLASQCLPAACGDRPCRKAQACVKGVCVDADCASTTCPSGQTCARSQCYPRDCASSTCLEGEICWQAESCRTSLCQGVACGTDETCADGRCLRSSCSGVTCGQGAACADGQCQDARCIGVVCATGNLCADGRCVAQACAGVPCPSGLGCVDGKCVDVQCMGVHCPGGASCNAGACLATAGDAGAAEEQADAAAPGLDAGLDAGASAGPDAAAAAGLDAGPAGLDAGPCTPTGVDAGACTITITSADAGACPSAASGFFGGSGTSADPYRICNCDQLQNVTHAPTKSFQIDRDIDCAVTACWNGGLGFEPIASFSGNLDGKHHVVNDLRIARPCESNVGLFSGLTGSATLTALGLVRPGITGGDHVGTFVGRILEGGWATSQAIQYVFSSDAVVNGGNGVGGLVGDQDGTLLSIEDSSFCGSVNGTADYVGGLAGALYTGSPGGSTRGVVRNTYVCGSLAGPRVGAAFSFAWEIDVQDFFSVVTEPAGSGMCVDVFGNGTVTGSYYAGATAVGPCGTNEPGGAAAFASTSHPVYATWDFVSVWKMGAAGLPLLRGFSTTP